MTLKEQVKELEAKLIAQALSDANGSVSRAAKLLGFSHHQSLISIMAARHKDLLPARTPAKRRRKSIIRRPVEQREGHWERDAL